MNAPLIHIGYQKTASTWLQRELFIPNSNVFLPLPAKDGKHSDLANSFFKDDDGFLLSSFTLNERSIKKQLEQLQTELDQTQKIPVITHERLTGDLNSGGFDGRLIADRIHSNLPGARILILFREQRDFIFSTYFQYLEEGGTVSIQRFLQTKYDDRRPGFSPGYVYYHELVQYYQNLFGKPNVLALPFELFRSEPHQFIERFSGFVDRKIEVNPESFKKRHNASKQYYAKMQWRNLTKYRTSNSLNSYSTKNRIPIKKTLNRLVPVAGEWIPKSWNQRVENEVKAFIEKWCDGRFTESNQRLSVGVDMDLNQYGYQ